MNKIKKILRRKIVWFFIILFTFVYFNNCSFLTKQRTGKPLLLAHRGLAQYLLKLPIKSLKQLTVYGGDKPIAVLQKRLPSIRVMSAATLKRGLLSYIALGWTGYIPASCKNTELHIPLKYAPLLWGVAKPFFK